MPYLVPPPLPAAVRVQYALRLLTRIHGREVVIRQADLAAAVGCARGDRQPGACAPRTRRRPDAGTRAHHRPQADRAGLARKRQRRAEARRCVGHPMSTTIVRGAVPPLDARARDALAAALERAPAHITRATLAAQAQAREAQRAETTKARERHDVAAVMEAALAALEPFCEDGDARVAALDRAILEGERGGLAAKAVDLGPLMREGIPPVEYLPGEFARRMVYAEGVTGFTGHPESGKTTTVSRIALDAIRAGTHVVYLD